MVSALNGPPPRELPAAASLEHLKKQAKLRLRALREQAPEALLADAQLAIARDYGFASWRALKAAIEQAPSISANRRFTGCYLLDPEVVTNSLVMITEERGQLFAQNNGRPRSPLASIGPDSFSVTGSPLRYRFERSGPLADRILIGTGERFVVAARTDAATAGKIEAEFAHELAEQARPRSRVGVDPEMLEAYVGFYASPIGSAVETIRRGPNLFARIAGQPEFEIQCEGPHRFFYPTLPVQISFDVHSGRAETLVLHQHGRSTILRRTDREAVADLIDEVELRRAEQERPRVAVAETVETLALYVGRYDLDQTTRLTVTLEGGRLFGGMTGQRRFEMFAEARAQFFLTVAAVQISFIEDASGRIDRAVIHQFGRDLVLMRYFSEGEEA